MLSSPIFSTYQVPGTSRLLFSEWRRGARPRHRLFASAGESSQGKGAAIFSELLT